MNDHKTTLEELKKIADQFVAERDWHQFHTPKDLSMDISIEAAELMEKFLWISQKDSLNAVNGESRQEICDELADIFFAILCFCNTAKIDISTAFKQKLKKIAEKYPVEKSKGVHVKYDKL